MQTEALYLRCTDWKLAMVHAAWRICRVSTTLINACSEDCPSGFPCTCWHWQGMYGERDPKAAMVRFIFPVSAQCGRSSFPLWCNDWWRRDLSKERFLGHASSWASWMDSPWMVDPMKPFIIGLSKPPSSALCFVLQSDTFPHESWPGCPRLPPRHAIPRASHAETRPYPF